MTTSCDLGRSFETNLPRHTDQYLTSPAIPVMTPRVWMAGSSMDYDQSDHRRQM